MRTVRSALALALLGLSALTLGACASSPPATPATAAGPPATAASTTESVPGATAIGPPQVAWADMSATSDGYWEGSISAGTPCG